MAINFPASPSTNDTHTENAITWIFNGTSWDAQGDQVTAASIGLGNVDNTADANKPVSTAQQTAIDAVGAPLTFLAIGQSNMVGNDAIAGDNYSPRDEIQVFNRTSAAFEDWDLTTPPPGLGTNKENFAYRLAQQLEKQGKSSRFIAAAVSGASITTFLPTTGANMVQLEADITAAGVSKIDGVVWMQGEQDGFAMSAATYKGHLDSIIAHVNGLFSDSQTPWVIGELANDIGGSDSKNRVFDCYVDDQYIRVMPNRGLPTTDGIHYTGAALVDMGRMAFNAFMGQGEANPSATLYQRFFTQAFHANTVTTTNISTGTGSSDGAYITALVDSVTAGVKLTLATDNFLRKVGAGGGGSSNFQKYDSRVHFRLPGALTAGTRVVVNLGVNVASNDFSDFTSSSEGVQAVFTTTGCKLSAADGSTLTTDTASGIASAFNIEQITIEVIDSKVRVYREAENISKTLLMKLDSGVPVGDYGSPNRGAVIIIAGDTGISGSQSVEIDQIELSTARAVSL